ncbi:nucleoside deaminase [Candidatus Cardinium hertigii]|uniref:tRNA-specific adenosine deaminase n=1 Tax=Candidatus Cardinium hertigii TaxID=247481 RepID=A0A2Z3LBY8_9BACT|nr:nucleoside deaminase [Candidatus Cardinium hertigii]AWN81446.1 tRNA-specific adenosine deaminase [Candidatus Cardinium hertigii]
MNYIEKDIYFMQFALKEAQKAAMLGEIPVGALMVADSKIIARGYNQTEMLQDPTAHAEIIALTAASNYFNSKYLTNCTLYVTLEPCIMCSGALYWAQIKRLVFGATDPTRGYRRIIPFPLHPKTAVTDTILAQESHEQLIEFFKKLRNPHPTGYCG